MSVAAKGMTYQQHRCMYDVRVGVWSILAGTLWKPYFHLHLSLYISIYDILWILWCINRYLESAISHCDVHLDSTTMWHRSSWSPCCGVTQIFMISELFWIILRVWRERIEPLEGKVVWPPPSWGCGGLLGWLRSRILFCCWCGHPCLV